MEIIPSIDLREGRCVRLVRGDFDRETTYGDPLAMARRWRDEGAGRLHVVDLDGSRAGEPLQRDLILAIAAEAGGQMAVQVGGGIRRLKDVSAYLDSGIERVVLGSAAIKDQETVLNACARHPGRIIVALDARDGKVTAEAWHEVSEIDAIELAEELAAAGVPRFLYTDIGRDGTLSGPNLPALKAMVDAVDRPLIASGGVGEIADVAAVRATGAEAMIIGKALYEGAFSLRAAMQSSTMA